MKAEDVARVQRWADTSIASRSLHMNGSHDAWPLVLRLIDERAALLAAAKAAVHHPFGCCGGNDQQDAHTQDCCLRVAIAKAETE